MTSVEFENLPDNEIEGRRIWVCDFFYHRLDVGKPTRNLKPTEVEYERKPHNPDPWGRYWKQSRGWFRTLAGSKAVKEINPYANISGQRAMLVFFSEGECIDAYLKLCNDAITALEERKQREIKEYDGKIAAARRSMDEWVLDSSLALLP